MRLTSLVYKQHIDWHFKQAWKRLKRYKLPPLYKPEFLDKQNIHVVDPNELYKQERHLWSPPVPDDPRWMPKPTIDQHPHYHQEPIKAIFHDSRLEYGLRQASILAKTQVFTGLPESVRSLVGRHPIKNQDDLVRRSIMHAHVWDSTKEQLPRRFNPDLPRWKFKSEQGIPKHKIARFLNNHLLRLTMTLSGKYPHLLKDRVITNEPRVETYIPYRGEYIQIKATPMCLISTNERLAPFGDERLLDESCSHNIDDLSPVSPLIDLKKSHIYTLQDSSALRCNRLLGYPHTVMVNTAPDNIVSNKFDLRKVWSTDQRQARALMLCLALTTQQARLAYGSDVSTLPEPISVQCIHHDGVFFNFLYFQLNTLNLDSLDGVKNLAWIDSDNRMVEKIEPKRAMLRNTIYQNYDPIVYDKFRATFLNGLNILDPDVEFSPRERQKIQDSPLHEAGTVS